MSNLSIAHPEEGRTVASLEFFAAFGYFSQGSGQSIFGELLDAQGVLVTKSFRTLVHGTLWVVTFTIKGKVRKKVNYAVTITDPETQIKANGAPFRFGDPIDHEAHKGISITYPGEREQVCLNFSAYGGTDQPFHQIQVNGLMKPKGLGQPAFSGPVLPDSDGNWVLPFSMATDVPTKKDKYKLEVGNGVGGYASHGHITIKSCPMDEGEDEGEAPAGY